MVVADTRWTSGLASAGAEVARNVLPGVVQVKSGRSGAGAGIVWGEEGLVLTNDHVVSGPEARVKLHDDRELDAEVVNRNGRWDLALLQLRDSPEDLKAVPFGNSDSLRVGELVFAFGNPWGRRGAVTAGVVGGVGPVPGFRGEARYIQSDAHLAPGNSGGPLVNARGEVVGVNAMISGGLSLSVPSNVAEQWWKSLRFQEPRLGVSVRPVRPAGRRRRRRPQGSVSLMVVGVEEGSLAEKYGLLVGDVLLEAVGEPPDISLEETVSRSAGGTLRLRTWRGGETFVLAVEVPGSGA